MFKRRANVPVIMVVLSVSLLQAQNQQCRDYCQQVLDTCRQRQLDGCEAGFRECLKGCPEALKKDSKQDENTQKKETGPKQVIPEVIEKPH